MSQVDSTETFIVQGGLINTQPTADETPTTILLRVSTQWELHLSVTPTHGNRTLHTSSRQWKALRAEILLRDNSIKDAVNYTGSINRVRFDAVVVNAVYLAVASAVSALLTDAGVDAHIKDEIIYVGGTTCLPGLDGIF